MKKLNQDQHQSKDKADTSELIQLQERLKKECKGDLGIVNANKALTFLNFIQKEECPDAYEPEIVILQKQKEQERQEKLR